MNFSGSSTSQDGFITFELYFVFFQTNFKAHSFKSEVNKYV
jgi:hypothetical protein